MAKAIYKITNKINNKIYIGQSIHPEQRFKEHCSKNEKYTSLIHDAILKYGKENFSFEILGWFDDYNQKEQEYIKFYNSLVPNGYNIALGGEEPPHGKGENNSFASITNEEAEKIKAEILDWNIPRKTIVANHHITFDIFRHMNEGTSWYDEKLTYPLRPSETELNEIRAKKVQDMLINTTLSQKEIGLKVGWKRSAVTMINIGKNHRNENLNYPLRKTK